MKITMLVLALSLAGCSTFRAAYNEVKKTKTTDSRTTVDIKQSVAPGGVQDVFGECAVGVNADGSWTIKITGGGQQDATRTAQMIESISKDIAQSITAGMSPPAAAALAIEKFAPSMAK